MATIKRHGPLKLIQIKTRGSLTYGISGIQLIYEHGVQSPVIDASRPGADQFKVSDIDLGKKICSITMREYRANFNALKIGFTDGTQQIICEYYPEGSERTLFVPENMHIAGFFGRNNIGYFIRSLGFILMEDLNTTGRDDILDRESDIDESR